MYLVIDKTDGKTIIHKNLHPHNNLQPSEVYSGYDSNIHTIIFTESFSEETETVKNFEIVPLCEKIKFENGTITELEYMDFLIKKARQKYYQDFLAIKNSNYLFTHDDNTQRNYHFDEQHITFLDQQRIRIQGTNEGTSWLGSDGLRYDFTYDEFIQFSNEVFDRGKNAKVVMDDNIYNLQFKNIQELETIVGC